MDYITFSGLISDGHLTTYRREINLLMIWCSHNKVEIEMIKTVEMIVDLRLSSTLSTPINLHDCLLDTADDALNTAITDLIFTCFISLVRCYHCLGQWYTRVYYPLNNEGDWLQ